ncbi:MAG: hypothetical protein ILNGONEN_00414 [Syntrophorhabdaceae bacterium]|nr:hypothetical protein [Syntrophorhabdaceae bacterium]
MSAAAVHVEQAQIQTVGAAFGNLQKNDLLEIIVAFGSGRVWAISDQQRIFLAEQQGRQE